MLRYRYKADVCAVFKRIVADFRDSLRNLQNTGVFRRREEYQLGLILVVEHAVNRAVELVFRIDIDRLQRRIQRKIVCVNICDGFGDVDHRNLLTGCRVETDLRNGQTVDLLRNVQLRHVCRRIRDAADHRCVTGVQSIDAGKCIRNRVLQRCEQRVIFHRDITFAGCFCVGLRSGRQLSGNDDLITDVARSPFDLTVRIQDCDALE